MVARQSAEDGSLVTVRETWKGSRAKGDVLRVPALRTFRKSQPRLDDPSGLDQISRKCDEILQALGRRQP